MWRWLLALKVSAEVLRFGTGAQSLMRGSMVCPDAKSMLKMGQNISRWICLTSRTSGRSWLNPRGVTHVVFGAYIEKPTAH